MNGWLGERDVAPQLGLVDQLPEPQARGAHQAPQIRKRADARDLREIPLEIRPHVSGEPRGASVLGVQFERRGGIPAVRDPPTLPVPRPRPARAGRRASPRRLPRAVLPRGRRVRGRVARAASSARASGTWRGRRGSPTPSASAAARSAQPFKGHSHALQGRPPANSSYAFCSSSRVRLSSTTRIRWRNVTDSPGFSVSDVGGCFGS